MESNISNSYMNIYIYLCTVLFRSRTPNCLNNFKQLSQTKSFVYYVWRQRFTTRVSSPKPIGHQLLGQQPCLQVVLGPGLSGLQRSMHSTSSHFQLSLTHSCTHASVLEVNSGLLCETDSVRELADFVNCKAFRFPSLWFITVAKLHIGFLASLRRDCFLSPEQRAE